MTAFPRRVTMIIATMAALAGAARAQDSIRPGYWESIDQVVSPLASRKTDRRCITPKDVAKFMSCYINHHYECVCPEETIGAGKIAFKGQCVDHKGQHVDIEGTGVFTATTLHMTARVNFKILGPCPWRRRGDNRRRSGRRGKTRTGFLRGRWIRRPAPRAIQAKAGWGAARLVSATWRS
jgi:hypothetical protein